ncbi:MAG: ParB/RepB/Spo0J family partition protein [Candidatus Microsaccharimonas sp.]
MSAAKKGLGRGFDSLIPTDLLDDSFDTTAKQDEKVSQQKTLPLSQVHANADQPRRFFDTVALEELAASIKEHGVIQPIIVTPKGDGYEIVAGERRYRASKLAGLSEIPVVIRTMSGQKQLEVSLIENIQRRDLNTIETATAYAKLRDQFNLNAEKIAERVHKSPSAVINTMRLLKLPKEAILALAEGKLSEGQARPLIGQDEALITELIPRIIAEEWSARKVEQYMVNVKQQQKSSEPAAKTVADQHDGRISFLRDRLKTDVAIRVNSKGAGNIVIKFKNADELERLQNLLGE